MTAGNPGDPATIYTLHHFAATGGTLFARAIGAFDQAVVLSEIHPDRHLPQQFNPVFQFTRAFGSLLRETDQAAIDRLFLEDIRFVHSICAREERVLFVRDHLHRDIVEKRRTSSRLCEVLAEGFDLRRIYTWRDPLDTWISMKIRSWTEELTPDAFIAAFLATFELFRPDERTMVFAYHDLVAEPGAFFEAVAELTGLPDPHSVKLDKRGHYTGSSGRQSADISARETRWGALSNDDFCAFAMSEPYRQFCLATGLPTIESRQPPPRLMNLLAKLVAQVPPSG